MLYGFNLYVIVEMILEVISPYLLSVGKSAKEMQGRLSGYLNEGYSAIGGFLKTWKISFARPVNG